MITADMIQQQTSMDMQKIRVARWWHELMLIFKTFSFSAVGAPPLTYVIIYKEAFGRYWVYGGAAITILEGVATIDSENTTTH